MFLKKSILAMLIVSIMQILLLQPAMANIPPNKEIEEVTSKLNEFLNNNSLEPFAVGKNWQYKALGYENISMRANGASVRPVVGKITNGKHDFSLVSLAYKFDQTNEVAVKLLYIADNPISTKLFGDIFTITSADYTDWDPVNTRIYIKNKHYNVSKGGTIELIFFNGRILKTYLVDLKPDGQGGTRFAIKSA